MKGDQSLARNTKYLCNGISWWLRGVLPIGPLDKLNHPEFHRDPGGSAFSDGCRRRRVPSAFLLLVVRRAGTPLPPQFRKRGMHDGTQATRSVERSAPMSDGRSIPTSGRCGLPSPSALRCGCLRRASSVGGRSPTSSRRGRSAQELGQVRFAEILLVIAAADSERDALLRRLPADIAHDHDLLSHASNLPSDGVGAS